MFIRNHSLPHGGGEKWQLASLYKSLERFLSTCICSTCKRKLYTQYEYWQYNWRGQTVVDCVMNPLHPNFSMYILHTVLYTFPKVLTRRIWLTIKSFLGWWSFHLFLWIYCLIKGWNCKEKLDANHYKVKEVRNKMQLTNNIWI